MEDKEFEMKRPMPPCPVLKVDGVIEKGLPEDQRDVIYGTIKNVFKEPVKNAVVKLIEIEFCKDGIKKRCPISHAFTDEYGEFVFGPLCPGKQYAIDIWVNDVRHYNISAKCMHEGKCLKCKQGHECECFEEKKEHECDHKHECER